MADADQAHRERLKAALWHAIGKMVDHESMALDLNATPQFILALTEAVWTQLENVATDLESFAKHANRSTVTTDDVLLLARRNEGLGELLADFINKEKLEREKEREKARSTAKPSSRGSASARGRGRGKR